MNKISFDSEDFSKYKVLSDEEISLLRKDKEEASIKLKTLIEAKANTLGSVVQRQNSELIIRKL